MHMTAWAHITIQAGIHALFGHWPALCIQWVCRVPSASPHRALHLIPPLPKVQQLYQMANKDHENSTKHCLSLKKPLESVLLDLGLTPIGPNMPLPWEILHNRRFQQPSKPSQPVNMERVQDYLLSCKQSQSTWFNKANRAHALPELSPGYEVLFRSPAEREYINGTIIDRATKPHSYIIEAQGRRYQWNREHLWSIHLNLPATACQPPPLHPTIPCIPKPNPYPNANPISHYQAHHPNSLPHSTSSPHLIPYS